MRCGGARAFGGPRGAGSRVLLGLSLVLSLGAFVGCGDDASRCGPTSATVTRVIDGDTIELGSGEKIRLLMVDTPETTLGHDDCYGQEAKLFTTEVLLGKSIQLTYDKVCQDAYGRLLAYVSVDGREINTLLVERGYARVLHIPPNGDDRLDEFETLEYQARTGSVGLWGACTEVTSGN